jgi:large subunit ribosomal protein L29
MATKKFLELQEYTDSDLNAELEKTEQEYQKLRFDHAVKGLDKPLVLKEVRRDIARLQTELRRRKVANMSAEELAQRTKIRARRRRK